MSRPALPPVTFPDVEKVLCDWLRPRLVSTIFVGNRLPEHDRPEHAVTVRRDGGPRVGPVLDVAQVGVNVWAPTDFACTDLAGQVRSVLGSIDLVSTPVRNFVEVSGPAWVPDESAHPHQYMTFEVTLRAA